MTPKTNRIGAYVLMLYLALLFYGFGVHMLESLMNYPLWQDMGGRMTNADFVANRRVFEWRIYPLLVIPIAARVPVTLALLGFRPRFVPRWAVVFALVMQVISWASSVTIQIPIQVTLTADGFSNELFDRLIVTDLWLRVLPGVCEVLVGCVLLRVVARRLTGTRAADHAETRAVEEPALA